MDNKAAEHLVDQVRRRGVTDPRVLNALAHIDREMFVPSDCAQMAHEDLPIDIGHGELTNQPSLIAEMVEALRLTGTERVLEVGAGLGYQTAILASLCRHVYAVEPFDDLARRARTNLERAGIVNAVVWVGEGALGLAAYAPYDAILVSSAAPSVPPSLADQLAVSGRLVQPIGEGGGETIVVYRKETDQRLHEGARLTYASFAPLYRSHLSVDEP